MRSALIAVAVLVLVAVTLTRSGLARAEPPPPMEERDAKKVIEALEKSPSLKPQLASVRFYVEVFGGETVKAPVGSPLTTLGAWGDDGTLQSSEGQIGGTGCAPLDSPARKKAAAALLAQYGGSLPSLLRGYALLEQGKNDEAEAIFVPMIEGALPVAGCPGEHPMYSQRRVSRMRTALACIARAAPKKNHAALEKAIERAASCASNNHAVG